MGAMPFAAGVGGLVLAVLGGTSRFAPTAGADRWATLLAVGACLLAFAGLAVAASASPGGPADAGDPGEAARRGGRGR